MKNHSSHKCMWGMDIEEVGQIPVYRDREYFAHCLLFLRQINMIKQKVRWC